MENKCDLKVLPENMHNIAYFSDFRIIHTESLTVNTLSDIARVVNLNLKRIKQFFDLYDVKFPVYVFESREIYHNFIFGKQGEPWMVGSSFNDSVAIIDPGKIEKDTGHNYEQMLQVLVHEITHLFTFWRGNNKKKRYMTEGIAAYIAGQFGDKRAETVKKSLTDIDYFAEEIFKGSYDSVRFGNELYGYPLSWTIIDYIIKTFGDDPLKEYFRSREYNPFKFIKVDFDEFIENWKQYLRDSFGECAGVDKINDTKNMKAK